MNHIKYNLAILICILVGGVLFYVASYYKVEEGISARYTPTVSWDSDQIVRVRCVRVSTEQHAKQLASKTVDEPPYAFEEVQNGDAIRIVELVSGFNDTRLLHAFIVAELEFGDGRVGRIVVPVTPEVLECRNISLDVGGVSSSDNNSRIGTEFAEWCV